MAPKPAAKALSPEEYLQKVSTDKVDIYVGPKRKHFSVPQGLLIHHSGYFAHRLTTTHKVEDSTDSAVYLLEDNADDFALIVDYLYRNNTINKMSEETDALKIKHCLDFIELCGKIEFGEAASVICPVLEDVLTRHSASRTPMALIEPKFITVAFNIIPTHHAVLTLLSKAALTETLKRSGGKYQKELREVKGFLRETWKQFHICREKLSFPSPLNPDARKTWT